MNWNPVFPTFFVLRRQTSEITESKTKQKQKTRKNYILAYQQIRRPLVYFQHQLSSIISLNHLSIRLNRNFLKVRFETIRIQR